MFIRQNIAYLNPSTESQEDFTFSTASQAYTNIEEIHPFQDSYRALYHDLC